MADGSSSAAPVISPSPMARPRPAMRCEEQLPRRPRGYNGAVKGASMFRRTLTLLFACACVALAEQPAAAQDLKAAVVKHLTTSRDFTLNVAAQMPEADYGFKLTSPQMSFGEQMAHLASDQANLLAPFTADRPAQSKPASMSKKDVIDFVRQSYDR